MEDRRENSLGANFDFPPSILDEIQKNIEDIILNFDIPEGNKLEVIKKINFMYSQTRYMSVTDPLLILIFSKKLMIHMVIVAVILF